MNGQIVAQIIDMECTKRRISKAKFHRESGVSSGTLSQWRTGTYDPTAEKLKAVEKYFDIDLSDYEKPEADEETMQLREMLRNRQDLRVLLHSAKDVPPSSIYALISQIEKMKEDST